MSNEITETEFGYYPQRLSFVVGDLEVRTLPGLEETVAALEGSEQIDAEWIYAPRREVCLFGGGGQLRPYASRVFGLSKTHVIQHAKAEGSDHFLFLVWALSFFLGIRLTTTNAGYVDSTPIVPGKLVDFMLARSDLPKALALADTFWATNRTEPTRAKRFAAAIHALFLSQNPQHLQFEEFILLYTAFDACYALAASLRPPSKRPNHKERIDWMCKLFGMTTPSWASPTSAEVANIRNMTLHEALFMDEPLGFALHGIGSNQNINLEMRALVCRLLVALVGAPATDYVLTPINTRQRHGLSL